MTETPKRPGPWEARYGTAIYEDGQFVAMTKANLAPMFVARLNAHDELVAALEELASCEELDLSMYGSFPGGDPRCFEPDEEVTTPEEIANWREACEAWNRGEGVDRGPSCQTLGDGSAVTGTGYGMGVFRWQHPAAASARALLARVRGEEIQG